MSTDWLRQDHTKTINQLERRVDQRNSDFYGQAINRLMILKDTLELEEKRFYDSLGLEGTPDECLAYLQNELDILNKDPGFSMLVNSDTPLFNDMVEAASAGVDLSKPIIISLKRNQGAEAIAQIAEQYATEVGDDVVGLLQAIRQAEKSGNKALTRGSKGKGFAKGMHLTGKQGTASKLATFQIRRNKNSLELEVQPSPDSVLNKKDIERLESVLHATVQTQSAEIRDNLKEKIVKNIQNTRLRNIVSQEFGKEWYDVNSSIASIKGFLGEIHAYSAMKFLFPQSSISATGNIRDLKGQEIPIDLVINDCGFQIKNYRISGKGKSVFQYEGKMGNFIETRIRPEQTLKELLMTFFGLYGYYPEGSPFIEMALPLLQNNGTIPKIFNAHLDNVMRISDVFSNKAGIDKLFGIDQTYYNTFFLIGNNLVPSSEMIQAMIDEIADQRTSDSTIRAQWFFEKGEGKKKSAETPNLLANRIGVTLNLTLNVYKVLSRIPKVAESMD